MDIIPGESTTRVTVNNKLRAKIKTKKQKKFRLKVPFKIHYLRIILLRNFSQIKNNSHRINNIQKFLYIVQMIMNLTIKIII